MIDFFILNYVRILVFNLVGLNIMDSVTTHTFLKYRLAQEGNVVMSFMMYKFGVDLVLIIKIIFAFLISIFLYWYSKKSNIHNKTSVYGLCFLNIFYSVVVIWNLMVI